MYAPEGLSCPHSRPIIACNSILCYTPIANNDSGVRIATKVQQVFGLGKRFVPNDRKRAL